ncbi:MAG TPA: arsenite methyltransferase [Thermomicrobiales bacterium]|nr:arsenite methyltransferase [Thermomicrobiales bacterium]
MVGNIELHEIRENVREKYAGSARRVIESGGCGSGCCRTERNDPVTSNLYSEDEIATLPQAAVAISLGCGNPTALTQLSPGETVLDLGSGGGVDVLLSAKRVGPTGFAYGVDMTDEMLEIAERNKAEAGVDNVAFLKGHIEDVPLPDNTVDVVISNCVINLASDKGQVLREAYRVLKPGGRFAVSDVVSQGELPADLRADMEAWVGCIAGALEEQEYRRLLSEAGFTDTEIQVTRVYDPRELADSLGSESSCCGGVGPSWDESALARFDASGGRVVSAFVRARKP